MEDEALVKKRYSIPYELFGEAFTVFQKKFVFPRNRVMSVLLLILAAGNVLNIMYGNGETIGYVLVLVCIALAFINWYNPRKLKRNLMESVKGIENDVYTLTIYPERIVIGTVLEPEKEKEPEEYEEESSVVECGLSDYEKALKIYNFMTANGSGTCAQYAYQTYEMCLEYGLECYFAWTENQLYGHVANVVKIDGVWYVLDTQAGCFLTENMCGFIEIVDENESYIASADIISSVRYE